MASPICNSIEVKQCMYIGVTLTATGIVSAVVTSVVSSATSPLVAGFFAPVAVVVAFVASFILYDMGMQERERVHPSTVVAVHMGGALFLTSLGFPISVPLSLLLVPITYWPLFKLAPV